MQFQQNPTQGLLFVAADVAPEHDADFNDWYDHEHVEERARIPGFVSAARYEAIGEGKRYLGLYLTASLGTFTTPAYRAAFGQQTSWSVTNLGRMLQPTRRVCAVRSRVGLGSGSHLSVVPLERHDDLPKQVADLGMRLTRKPGVVRTYLLDPDPALSTPLPMEALQGRRLLPLFVVECSAADVNDLACDEAVRTLTTSGDSPTRYALKWKLFNHELEA